MKKIRTQSTLVSAKHGLVTNGRYTKIFSREESSKYPYAYELRITDPTATGCTVTCQMAAPTVLQFQTVNPVPMNISMTGGYGLHSNEVLALNPPPAGRQQKIELDAKVEHQIGQIKFQDALSIRVK